MNHSTTEVPTDKSKIRGKCPRHRNPLEAIAAVGAEPWKQLKATVRELTRRARKT